MLQLPIGYDNFRKIRENKLDFVDKSLFIKEILDDVSTEVLVITRPRRFGKTVNLSMLQHFLAKDIDGVSTQGLFDGLNITRAGDEYLKHHSTYPVIFLTFKDIKDDNFDNAYAKLEALITELYQEHRYLLEQLSSLEEKMIFQSILERRASQTDISMSIKKLCEHLFRYHGKNPWLLIDEYDTPLQSAYVNNYYDPMINVLRNLFGYALKGNKYLHRSVITGILRIAKESLFSGVNNLQVYSPLDPQYSHYFGFTEPETNDLLKQSDLESKTAEIKEWYNGYQIGGTILYNPWSIVNCIKNNGTIRPYWVNTSGNELIRNLVVESDDDFKDQLNLLLQGKPITQMVDEKIVFLDLNQGNTAIWSLLLFSGYLKVVSETLEDDGLNCSLMIPNREVRNLFRQIITQWISKGKGIEWMKPFIQSLLDGNMEQFETSLTNIIEQTVSYHDTSKYPETFYHGMMIGLTAILYNNPDYQILSNRESGLGRYDYMILSKDVNKPTIIFELKKSKSEELLETDAKKALEQIQSHRYFAQAQQNGNSKILCIGLAFHKKHFCIQHAILRA